MGLQGDCLQFTSFKGLRWLRRRRSLHVFILGSRRPRCASAETRASPRPPQGVMASAFVRSRSSAGLPELAHLDRPSSPRSTNGSNGHDNVQPRLRDRSLPADPPVPLDAGLVKAYRRRLLCTATCEMPAAIRSKPLSTIWLSAPQKSSGIDLSAQ